MPPSGRPAPGTGAFCRMQAECGSCSGDPVGTIQPGYSLQQPDTNCKRFGIAGQKAVNTIRRL